MRQQHNVVSDHQHSKGWAINQGRSLTFWARGRTSFQSSLTYTSSTWAEPVFLKRSFRVWPSDFVMNADGIVIFLRYLHTAKPFSALLLPATGVVRERYLCTMHGSSFLRSLILHVEGAAHL